jgi:hypothetical protein
MKGRCTLMLARVLLFVQVRGLKYAAGWLAGEAFKCLDMSGFLVTIK